MIVLHHMRLGRLSRILLVKVVCLHSALGNRLQSSTVRSCVALLMVALQPEILYLRTATLIVSAVLTSWE